MFDGEVGGEVGGDTMAEVVAAVEIGGARLSLEMWAG
jgi:hypothetical protein